MRGPEGPGGRKPWPWAAAGAGPVSAARPGVVSVSWLAAVVLAVVLLGWPAAVTALAAEPDTFMAGEHWADIDQFLLGQQTAGEPVTFTDLVSALAEGRGKEAGQVLLALLEATLIREIRSGGRMAGQLLALGIMGAVFTSFSGVFQSSQVSETGFFLTYLLVAAVLAAAVLDGVMITKQVLERQVEFMRVLLPSYLIAVTWAGGSLTGAAWMELLLFLLAAVPWLYLNLLLPLVRVYTLLVMVGNMGSEDKMSRMREFVQGVIRWGSRTLIGVVAGFQIVQGMVLPYADAVKNSGFQKILEMIPGVGQGMGAAAKVILGSGVLIKNAMGAAAVVVLLLLSLVPVLKLAVLCVLYRAAASILQPVGDKRLVACIAGVAEGERMLLGLTVAGMMVFVLAIALICAGTNVSYLG
ncbi:MAG: sporulation protein [Lachnospiraceae bacterium]|jgi:stage III sporulation protein AE|nr:sporulation protein [Lachnospiraceae bacterium]